MGAFFTSVQAPVEAGAVDAVVEALVAHLAPLRPCGPGEAADREVALVVGDGWLSIYDQGTEDQDDRRLEALAKAVAAVTGRAFAVRVHDSDVLRLALVDEAGVDRFDSAPGYFSGRRGRRRDAEDVARRWARSFGVEAGSLETVFGEDRTFAEGALDPLGRALGLAPERLRTGHGYLEESGLAARARRLGFRSEERPPWETKHTGAPRLATERQLAQERSGQPLPAIPMHQTLAVAGERAQLMVRLMSAGGPGQGLDVRVSGGPPVAWDTVIVRSGHHREFAEHRATLTPEEGGAAGHVAMPLAAGAVPMDPMEIQRQAMTGAISAQALLQAKFADALTVLLEGAAQAPGSGEVEIEITPVGGQGPTVRAPLRVVAATSRPLRSPPAVSPLALVPLLDDACLVLFAVLRDAAAARALVAPLEGRAPQDGKVRTVRYPRPTGGRLGLLASTPTPKQSTGRAKGFLRGQRWSRLLADLPEHGLVTADWVADLDAVDGPVRLAVGEGMLPIHDDLMPVLTLSAHRDHVDADALEAALRLAVDDALSEGQVVQAVLTRWGQPSSIESTPYEAACGLFPGAPGRRAWSTRWLRGVGRGSLWVGRELVAQLDHRPDGVVPLGSGFRLDIEDVRAAEEALADLLPTREQAMGMLQRLQ